MGSVDGRRRAPQALFTRRLLQSAKAAGLHTALDTSGFLGARADEALLDATDLVLLDIKAGTDDCHRALTGPPCDVITAAVPAVEVALELWPLCSIELGHDQHYGASMAATRVPDAAVIGQLAAAAALSTDAAGGDCVGGGRSAVDEARLDAILEIASDALLVADQDGTIVLANELAAQMFGYLREELVGEPVEVLVPSGARAAHVLHRLGYGEHPLAQRLELSATRSDGEEFPVEVTLTTLGVQDGVLVVASVRDISERRREEAQSARLAAVVSSSHEAIIAKTLDGIITDWNPAAERMYGYLAQEMIGTSISVLLACEGQRTELGEILASVRDGRAVENLVTTRRRKDGRVIDVELTVSPVRCPRGQIVGASTVGRDITLRQRAVEALRCSQQRLELAEAIVRMGSSEWDLATGRIVWSPGMYSILQLQPGADGVEHETDLRDRVLPRDREVLRQALDEALSGIGGVSVQCRAIRADGRVRVLDWHADAVFDEHGKATRLIEVVHDITESMRMQPSPGEESSKLAAYSPLIIQLASAVNADVEQQLLQAALTEKQLEVLRLIAQGLTNAAIGRRLFIAEGTVKWHVKQILEKTESTNRTEAVARVLGAGSAASGT